MAATALKLEAFVRPKPQLKPEPTFTQEDLDRARSEGYAAGLEQGRLEDVSQLCTGLEHIGRTLADDVRSRGDIRRETMTAVIPLLTGIVDALAPLNTSPRIGQALIAELAKLAERAPPVSVRIACSDQLRPLVEECIARSDIVGVELEETASDRISLSFTGGHIEICNEKIAMEIKKLITEIEEDSKNE